MEGEATLGHPAMGYHQNMDLQEVNSQEKGRRVKKTNQKFQFLEDLLILPRREIQRDWGALV